MAFVEIPQIACMQGPAWLSPSVWILKEFCTPLKVEMYWIYWEEVLRLFLLPLMLWFIKTFKVSLNPFVLMCSCLFSAYPSGEVAYDVQWFQSPAQMMENGAVPLISMDHWGVVKKSGGNESTQCTLERTDRDTFVLSVYHVQDRDRGEYYCTAKLWHFSPDTRLWSEGQKVTSAPVFLSINLACKDFSMLL